MLIVRLVVVVVAVVVVVSGCQLAAACVLGVCQVSTLMVDSRGSGSDLVEREVVAVDD